MQQAAVVHFIPLLLLGQAPHPPGKAVDVSMLLIKLLDPPLLLGRLGAQLPQLPAPVQMQISSVSVVRVFAR